MRVLTAVPAGWDERVTFPVLSRGFAEAMVALGHRPLFVDDERGRAVAFVRRMPIPVLGAWTSRARVYLDGDDPRFVTALLERLAAARVGYVRLGDPVWPLPARCRGLHGLKESAHHLFLYDPRVGEDALLAAIDPKVRTHLRKAQRDGVVVSPVESDEELREYCVLAAQTAKRMRQRDVGAGLSDGFFRAVFRTMVPRGQARFLMARADGQPLAGALFLLSPSRMTYFHGASTRDPELTRKQGPTALVWEALRLAHGLGVACFDHGAVTVTEDPAHPHYPVYQFKRRFGGRLTPIASGERVLSAVQYGFQKHVMMPVWKRVHQVYGRFAAAGAVLAVVA